MEPLPLLVIHESPHQRGHALDGGEVIVVLRTPPTSPSLGGRDFAGESIVDCPLVGVIPVCSEQLVYFLLFPWIGDGGRMEESKRMEQCVRTLEEERE